MLDGLTKSLDLGRMTDVGWTEKETGCRTSKDVGWTDKEAGCRTSDRC